MRLAARQPDQVAVHTREGDTSFGELAMRARQVAERLSAVATPRVLIAYEQGSQAYAAMLGTLMAGGYYTPVNVASPLDKLAAICREFEPDFLLAEEPVGSALGRVVPQAQRITLADIAAAPPYSGSRTDPLAYVIFTSGSTGTPKGVMISRAALAHYIDWVVGSTLFVAGDLVSQYTNLGFDLSVLDILGALCSGATIVPFVARGDRLLPAQAIAEHGLTVWVSTPSAVSLMMRMKQLTQAHLASVRRFFFIGEPLLDTHVSAIFAVCPAVEIWNAYGPTEATVSMTCLPLTADTYRSAVTTSVALGAPIPGMELHVLGGDHPDEGELVIVGPQLAEGYWRDAPKTDRAFRHLSVAGTMRRAYFSGDWVRVIGGQVYFQSRIDHQVKINGFRLELDEVAAAIRALGWPDVVVLKLHGRLTAFVESTQGDSIDAIEKKLLAGLHRKLERHAIPTRFFALRAFPRSLNDKIDLAALTALAAASSQAEN